MKRFASLFFLVILAGAARTACVHLLRERNLRERHRQLLTEERIKQLHEERIRQLLSEEQIKELQERIKQPHEEQSRQLLTEEQIKELHEKQSR